MTEATLDRARVLKHGELFAVFDRYGDIWPESEGAHGLYLGDTRYLSHLALLIEGRRPVLLSSTVQDDNAVMTADLTTHTDREVGGAGGHQPSHILRSKLLVEQSCFERIQIRNYGREPCEIPLELVFDADYADIFEVRGTVRKRRGLREAATPDHQRVRYRYRGLDGADRTTDLWFSRPPDELVDGKARFRVILGPQQAWELDVIIRCEELTNGEPASIDIRSYDLALTRLTGQMETERARWATLTTSSELFNAWLARSFEDLKMLSTDTGAGVYPYAGTPWFSTVFGRDGIITALECLWVAPHLARGVLEVLMATQAEHLDPATDAEPGKILHETRRGEMARLGEVPFGRYYGSADATPLFVYLAGRYLARTGDVDFAARAWPAVEAALGWIERHGDRDGDGYVEYARGASSGLLNQAWKDSDDCISHEDGRLAEVPLALCEVQAYVFGAWRQAAALARAVGHAELAPELMNRAAALQARFERDFWDEELQSYCLALDGLKRPCRVRSSNAGHCLAMGIASPEHATRLAETLMSPALHSGWGIRTLSLGEKRFSPLSYHNGSVWPHDNAIIAAGFSRYGMQHHVCRLLQGLFEAACSYELHRLPELFCGFERRRGEGPTRYPVACRPQAWAAGAVYMLLAAALGIDVDGRHSRLFLRNPVLPGCLSEVRIEGLRVGQGEIDMVIRRHTREVGVEVTRREGPVKVTIVK